MKKLAGLDTLGKHGVEVGPAAPLRVVHPARAIVAPEKHTIVPSARPSRVLPGSEKRCGGQPREGLPAVQI